MYDLVLSLTVKEFRKNQVILREDAGEPRVLAFGVFFSRSHLACLLVCGLVLSSLMLLENSPARSWGDCRGVSKSLRSVNSIACAI